MPSRFFSFSLLIGTAAVLGHLYLYRRLLRDTLLGRPLRLLGVAVLVALSLLLMVRRRLQDALPAALADTLAVASYVWMGLGLCLVLALVAADVAWGLVALSRWLRPATPAGPPAPLPAPAEALGRRQLLGRAVAGGAVLAGGGLAGYGSWRAFTAPEVSEVVLRVPRLPKALEGLTLVQLSDLHVGPIIRRRFMDELVRQANALEPDLFAITGDLVDGDVPTLGESVAALGNLKSRYGSYFVTGNHDYYSGDEAWTAFLEGLGVQVLRNRRVSIGDAGGALDLVGVDDWSGGRRRGKKGYDLEQALAGRDAEKAAVLLAHQPANFTVAAQRGIDVQLSGHTHGGQLFPMTLLVGMAWEHSAGLYRHQDAHLYVSRGCGFWGPPMRLGSPPELVKVVLTS